MSAQSPPEVAPADVAAWLRARTQDSQGREIGLWTEDTRPTVEQVEHHIRQAQTLIALRVGDAIPGPCGEGYSTVVALMAACIIEKQYWPEQVDSGRSNYDWLTAELERHLTDLLRCVVDGGLGPGGGGGRAGGAYDMRTPLAREIPRIMIPANWNDPVADNIDDPIDPSPATGWLLEQQFGWRGRIDAEGNPIGPEPR